LSFFFYLLSKIPQPPPSIIFFPLKDWLQEKGT